MDRVTIIFASSNVVFVVVEVCGRPTLPACLVYCCRVQLSLQDGSVWVADQLRHQSLINDQALASSLSCFRSHFAILLDRSALKACFLGKAWKFEHTSFTGSHSFCVLPSIKSTELSTHPNRLIRRLFLASIYFILRAL